jgi:hypothetical protein
MNRNDPSSRIWPRLTWEEALEQPGSGQLGYLRKLMETRPFLTRIPDQELLAGDNPSFASDHIRVTRDGTPGKKDATYLMLYLPYFRSFSVNTSVIKGEQLKIWWYDPRTGHAFPQGTLENNGEFTFSNWSDLIREGAGGPDWVVVIDDAGAGYAAPGR